MTRSKMKLSGMAMIAVGSIVGAVTTSSAIGCGGSSHGSADAGVPIPPALRADVVAALATNVIVVETQSFESAAAALDVALAAYAASPADTSLRDAARAAWRTAMDAWQRLELLEVGPAASAADAIGGLDLAVQIYSWPLVSLCGIDQRLVSMEYANPATLAAAPATVRGLASIEYLLFNPSTGNQCGTLEAINASGTWAAIPDLDARRAAYASSAASLVHGLATQLRTAWDPAGGNFVGTITSGGTAGNPYPSAQEALNGLSNALFYLDLVTKDMKIAIPAGISASCGFENCPASVESKFADYALTNLGNNLAAFRLLYTGGAGTALGFDDLLVSVQQEPLSAAILAALDAVDASLAGLVAMGPPLETLVVSSPTEVAALYDAIRALTDLLKTQFITVLDLERPMSGATDND